MIIQPTVQPKVPRQRTHNVPRGPNAHYNLVTQQPFIAPVTYSWVGTQIQTPKPVQKKLQ